MELTNEYGTISVPAGLHAEWLYYSVPCSILTIFLI